VAVLGIARENEGVAARILLDFGADSERIRNAVLRMLSGPARAEYFRRASVTRVRGPAESKHGTDAGAMFTMIERQIRAFLHREPDNGDLLVILSSLPEGIVGRSLAAPETDDPGLGDV
jgi:Clp amino terminal domain, pathogenicity island component